MPDTAITTLCIGDKYLAAWEKYCRKNWESYAQRHGLDLVVFDSPLDTSSRASTRSPSWQKCLILESLEKYERVVWLDADIVINSQAPSVIHGVPLGKVGAVISGSCLHPDMLDVFRSRARKNPADLATQPLSTLPAPVNFYQQVGVTCISADVVQCGVLVLDQSHRSLLRNVYDAFPGELLCYEQFPLSAALLNAGLLHPLNSRFNMTFFNRAVVHYPYVLDRRFNHDAGLVRLAVLTELSNSYFLHFAESQEFMPYCV